MNVHLDTPVRVGGATVAAVARVEMATEAWRSGAIVWAEKMPLAVLVLRESSIRAFDMAGEALSEPEVEALCPGAAARLRGAANAQ